MMTRTHRIVALLVLLPIIAQTFVVHHGKESCPYQITTHNDAPASLSTPRIMTRRRRFQLHVGVSADPQFSSPGYQDESDQNCDQDAQIANALEQLDIALDGMKPKKIKCWREAQEKCPQLTNSNEKLLFLQSEDFDVPRAAKKLTDYWTKRV